VKKGIENIDETFKQLFEGFEADVDPSVWNNIQASIAPAVGGSAHPNPSSTSVVGKSLALKLVTGVLAISAITTGVYFITEHSKTIDDNIEEIDIVSDIIPKENNVLSFEETVPVVVDPIEIAGKNSKEEILKNTVSLKGEVVRKSYEVVNSEVGEMKPSDKDGVDAIEKSVKEKTTIETAKEIEIKPVVEINQPNIIATEADVLKGAILASVTKGDAPLDINFEIEGENIVSYSWDFGDNSVVDNQESVFHTFEEPGRYKVELIILDENSNSKTLIKYIEVEDPMKPTLGFVQNAFSPNGDGYNDVYKLTTARNIKTFNAKVRKSTTGKLVYEWNSIDEGWSGNDFSDRKLEPGSYSLSIQAVGINGKPVVKNLMITILE